ncbi:MAG: hypothetical protein Q7U10_10255 [Thermodesulfovibrionia bacterium]|nr:hypothetical protein [Thermodesulfovibrionia bacterium]
MESENDFFLRDQTQRTIKKFIGEMDMLQTADAFEEERNRHIKLVLNSMLSTPDQWSANCTININWVGNEFISLLANANNVKDKSFLDSIYSMCFRFLLELELSIKGNLVAEYEQARKFASTNLTNFTEHAKSHIEFALRAMPIAILKSLISHDNIGSIKDFNKTAENADRMRKEWNKELEDKATIINQLKENLDKYKDAFNFVGLYQGFDELASVKNKEKTNILRYLRLFGFLIVVPIISEILYIMYNIEIIENSQSALIVLLIPTISLIGILIYYFKILLLNFSSVKSQLLQLELRKTLCRFIQNYVDYSTEIKKKDKESLVKFENIVFSGLVTNDEKLPSTFDGIEQITNLIKSLKSS